MALARLCRADLGHQRSWLLPALPPLARGCVCRWTRYQLRLGRSSSFTSPFADSVGFRAQRTPQTHRRIFRKHASDRAAAGRRAAAPLDATTFTPSRLRLASSRLRLPGASTSRIVRVSPSSLDSACRNSLVLCESSVQPSTTVSFCVRQFRGKRRAQRAQHHLPRQRVGIAAGCGPCTVPPLRQMRRADRSDARAARALLPPQLAARARNFAAAFGLVRSRALTRQIPAHRFVQQVRIHRRRQIPRRPAPPGQPSCPSRFLTSTTAMIVASFVLRICVS